MKKLFNCLILTLLLVSTLCSCSNDFKWPSSELGKTIPKLENVTGKVHYDYADSLYIVLEEISPSQYDSYVLNCKTNGFSIDVIEGSSSYTAFNSDGYKIDVSYFNTGSMWINAYIPITMEEITWPTNDIAKLLPTPKSTLGKIEWVKDYGFVIYVGNTSKSDYNDYVNNVKSAGFTTNIDQGDTYFYADNESSYRVSLKYEGFDTMFVRIDAPKTDDTSTTESSITTENTVAPPTETVKQENTSEVSTTIITEKTEPDSVFYSSNDYETATKGNTGVFSYKNDGKFYDIYWIIDFDEGYVYYFTEGEGNTFCDRLKIESGDLNTNIVITYHDGETQWSYVLHFKYVDHPETLIMVDNNGFKNEYKTTDLGNALDLLKTKDIKDY